MQPFNYFLQLLVELDDLAGVLAVLGVLAYHLVDYLELVLYLLDLAQVLPFTRCQLILDLD